MRACACRSLPRHDDCAGIDPRLLPTEDDDETFDAARMEAEFAPPLRHALAVLGPAPPARVSEFTLPIDISWAGADAAAAAVAMATAASPMTIDAADDDDEDASTPAVEDATTSLTTTTAANASAEEDAEVPKKATTGGGGGGGGGGGVARLPRAFDLPDDLKTVCTARLRDDVMREEAQVRIPPPPSAASEEMDHPEPRMRALACMHRGHITRCFSLLF